MEPVTHLLTGACLGRAGFNRTTALATLTMTLAAEAPDLDVLFYAGGSVTGFAHHRGFTHSILGAPITAAVVIAGVYGVYRFMQARGRPTKTPPNWKLLYLYAVLANLVHVFQDYTNNYGVRPFWPFYERWFSWDIVSILDPIMLLVMFAALVTPGIFALISEEVGDRRKAPRGRGAAIAALLVLAGLIFVRAIEHRRAVNALNSLTYREQEPLRAAAFGHWINPFSWNGLVETRDFFQMMPVNSLAGEVDPKGAAFIRYKPEETPATLAAKKSRLGRVYLDWAGFPVVEAQRMSEGGGYLVHFADLRFYGSSVLGRRATTPLQAYVILDSQLNVVEEGMGRAPGESSTKEKVD